MIELHDQFPLAALSDSRTLFEIGLIIVLAAAAPLIAQVLRVPSILLLLALGFGAGAIGALDPNALLGEAVVSATVPLRDRGRRWTRPPAISASDAWSGQSSDDHSLS